MPADAALLSVVNARALLRRPPSEDPVPEPVAPELTARHLAMVVLGMAVLDSSEAEVVARATPGSWPDDHLRALARAISVAPPLEDQERWVCRVVAPMARGYGVRRPVAALLACGDAARAVR